MNAGRPKTKMPVALVIALIASCGCIFVIVPIVGAVLLPVFSQARSNARDAVCMSNVKQAVSASLIYAQDYDSQLPQAARWCDEIAPYYKDISTLRCPQVTVLPRKAGSPNGYAYNVSLSQKNVNKLTTPRTMPLIYDSTRLDSWCANDKYASLPNPPRHKRGNTVGYADGHVQFVLPKP